MMVAQSSLLGYLGAASPVVKAVLFFLLVASIASWTFIFQRWQVFRQSENDLETFEEQFWSGTDLNKLYDTLSQKQETEGGISRLFTAGFSEFHRLRQTRGIAAKDLLDGVQRAIKVSMGREIIRLEENLPLLATIGSVSPYVGLFGTVWGIMMAFQGLSQVQQATIAMVAPGISEALIATAMGLFAAIPAVIAYNRYNAKINQLLTQYELFQEELMSILKYNLLPQSNEPRTHDAALA